MKLLRTSFAHLVREKIIQGESELLPDPLLAKDIVPVRMNTNAKEGKVFDTDHFGGSLLYRESDTLYTDNTSDITYLTQGPIGYGAPPVGPGTKPYYTMLSNSTANTTANQRGIYTGKTTSPHIPEFRVYVKGDVAAGMTWSVGQAEQKTIDGNGTETHIQCGPGKHVLMSLDPRLRTNQQVNNSNAAYTLDDNNIPQDNKNALHFIYEIDPVNELKYKLYVARGEWDGYNSSDVPAGFMNVTAPQDFVHLQNSYKRLLPVHFKLNKDGTGEFRVETSTIQFDLTAMPGEDGTNFAIPAGLNSGDDHAMYRVGGLNPRTYTGGEVNGMSAPVVVLGNIAVNDADNSDGLGDDGLPPFIAGIPMTPIRRTESHDDPNNEDEYDVIDIQKNAGGDDAWIPYSYSGNAIPYNNPLEAVVDGQMYDTRGLAVNALSADLDVQLDYVTIKNRWSDPNDPNGTINAVNIEAINIAVENASVFGAAPGELSLAVKIASEDPTSWTTTYKKADALSTNSELDSHVTFFNKTDTFTSSLTGFDLDDFNSKVTIRSRAMETVHIP